MVTGSAQTAADLQTKSGSRPVMFQLDCHPEEQGDEGSFSKRQDPSLRFTPLWMTVQLGFVQIDGAQIRIPIFGGSHLRAGTRL
jgi:hypothetical protein